jgi:hypothetical protein
VASSIEKDVETMPTQKIFKQRVRARMTKTGESYTAARRQLLRKAGEAIAPEQDGGTDSDGAAETTPPTELLMSDEAMVRGSGRSHAEWFTLLDAWGATERAHTEIAAWLRTEHGVDGWWTQSITVDYERARGMRGRHQQRDGYSIDVRKTVAVEPARALAAFTNGSLRRRWLPDAEMRQRPTRAALTARFDWSDPTSRVVVTIVPKGPGKATVTISHERLPDAESAERFKGAWRHWLADLKSVVERG